MAALVFTKALVHTLQRVLRFLLGHTVLLVLSDAALEACSDGCLGLDWADVQHGSRRHLLLVDTLLATSVAA